MSKKKRTKRSGHPGRAAHLTLVGRPSAAQMDPDYEDIRDWLGLAPDEQIDPLHFDVAEADAALSALRIPAP